jgi:hypothetical protein|tara:strand:+ start:251 stop:472 length:222 start_codon:yes stop_codon:yes gene_type:complete
MTKQWHGGKGSTRRNSDDNAYADNWEKIFGKKKPEVKARKETPSHASTQMHLDKTKVIPRKGKANFNWLENKD